ncbi:MAG: hypothetical protein V4508_07460 [Pseudomonadota bacterium]
MAIHQAIQNLLLVGVRMPPAVMPAKPELPRRLLPLIEAISPSQREYNAIAVKFGHRYRSAFWAIYMLSALAVMCAGLPLALGWDDVRSGMSHLSGIWVLSELLIIAAVGFIYWRGHRQNWQSQWLGARTKAELAWYLPLIAPLVDFQGEAGAVNWYAHLFTREQPVQAGDDIDILCVRNAALARSQLETAWTDPQFIDSYARWAITLMKGQSLYHRRLAIRQHALQHRVHAINTWLFGLTALGALAHLVVHSRVLSLVTTFFPAMGASLHGALAQSEAYRLEATSERLTVELERVIDDISKTLAMPDLTASAEALKAAILAALTLILDEHKDWHMLVRPHHLPLG